MKYLRKLWNRLTGSGRLKVTRQMYLRLLDDYRWLSVSHLQTVKELKAYRDRNLVIEPELKNLQQQSLQLMSANWANLELRVRIVELEQQVNKARKVAKIFDN